MKKPKSTKLYSVDLCILHASYRGMKENGCYELYKKNYDQMLFKCTSCQKQLEYRFNQENNRWEKQNRNIQHETKPHCKAPNNFHFKLACESAIMEKTTTKDRKDYIKACFPNCAITNGKIYGGIAMYDNERILNIEEAWERIPCYLNELLKQGIKTKYQIDEKERLNCCFVEMPFACSICRSTVWP